ncbi:MAG: hypothetical protein JRN09_08275 [Nitrososphaerota archaeon]|nr:hypothetical protein [Nitrososphaerota archaeon]
MTASPLGRLHYERFALGAAFAGRIYLLLFLALSMSVSVLYMFLLPSLPLGALVPYAIQFITPTQVAFALTFGVLIALVATLDVYAFRMRASSVKAVTVGSILASLVNGLCCTPLIPSLIAMTGASTPALYEISPRLQAFFEFNSQYFYALSVALLLISVHYLSRSITSCCDAGKRAGQQ